jgi:hypothetical protein
MVGLVSIPMILLLRTVSTRGTNAQHYDAWTVSSFLFFIYSLLLLSLWNRGFTLEELAQALVTNVGARYAINMDGGGSSTMVYEERVVNRPTCLDIPIVVCQRPIATVMCVSGSHHRHYHHHHHHPMETKETERNNVPKE